MIMHTNFCLGFSHMEILECLAQSHGIIISIRTLRRILKTLGLYSRTNKSEVLEVAFFIFSELQDYGQLHGYKLMHLKCIQNGFVVIQDTVRILFHILDSISLKITRGQHSCGCTDTPVGVSEAKHFVITKLFFIIGWQQYASVKGS